MNANQSTNAEYRKQQEQLRKKNNALVGVVDILVLHKELKQARAISTIIGRSLKRIKEIDGIIERRRAAGIVSGARLKNFQFKKTNK